MGRPCRTGPLLSEQAPNYFLCLVGSTKTHFLPGAPGGIGLPCTAVTSVLLPGCLYWPDFGACCPGLTPFVGLLTATTSSPELTPSRSLTPEVAIGESFHLGSRSCQAPKAPAGRITPAGAFALVAGIVADLNDQVTLVELLHVGPAPSGRLHVVGGRTDVRTAWYCTVIGR